MPVLGSIARFSPYACVTCIWATYAWISAFILSSGHSGSLGITVGRSSCQSSQDIYKTKRAPANTGSRTCESASEASGIKLSLSPIMWLGFGETQEMRVMGHYHCKPTDQPQLSNQSDKARTKLNNNQPTNQPTNQPIKQGSKNQQTTQHSAMNDIIPTRGSAYHDK